MRSKPLNPKGWNNHMKRFLGILLTLAICLTCVAHAAELTDAPGTPTQDVVLELSAHWLDEEHSAYDLQVMEADQLTMDTVTEIYSFVHEDHNRPVRYFPEETQRQIEEMLAGIVNPDALYMTEFMRLHAAQAEPEANLLAEMLLDVDYQIGQLVLVVLGDTDDPENLLWTPVEAKVVELGKLEFTVPQALMRELQGEDVLFSLLTVRGGGSGSGAASEEEESEQRPSKTAKDTTQIVDVEAGDGAKLADDFRLVVVDESKVIREELARIRKHVREEELPACSWLPEVSQNEIQLLLTDDLRREELVVYDYLPLITENYIDTYGDVLTAFSFATPYEEGQQVVTALGLPRQDAVGEDETLMNWAVQRARVNEKGKVEIVFDQLALIGMGEETGLLLIFCDPFEIIEE